MSKILAYIRVSTIHQNPDNQKLEIERYAAIRGLEVTDWIVLSVSTRKSELTRRIQEIKSTFTNGDTLITTELSRLGRSLGMRPSLME